MTGGSTPAMDIGGGRRRSERLDSDRTSEDMSYIPSPANLGTSFVDLQHESGDMPLQATLHEANYSFSSSMPPLKEEADMKCLLETDIPLLPGEEKQFISGKCLFATEDGFLMVTNYRIIAMAEKNPQRLVIIPVLEVELIELTRTYDVKLHLKGGRIHSFVFFSSMDGADVTTYLKAIFNQLNRPNSKMYAEKSATTSTNTDAKEKENQIVSSPADAEVFAWAFSAAVDKELPPWLKRADYVANEITHIDFRRLGMEEDFYISNVNEKFEVCPTYPEKVIVPKAISDEDIRNGAPYRSIGRFPAVIWRCTKTRAILMRSSQPQVGILSWRNSTDEKIIEEAVKTTRVEGEENKQFIILDARGYTSAFANRARSGGFENSEYYQQAKLEFLGLPNIHTIRNSFSNIRTMLHNQTPNEQMLQSLQGTGWLNSISNLLVNAATCAEYLAKGHSVLVHCSDGWDRTTQVTTLAKLMLDEHYRTIDGFSELIRRDWIAFGHKLSDRNMVFPELNAERSPIFSQFIEAVRHLQRVQPTAFQFSHAYLIKLAQHAYSGLFGTFLFNSHKERKEAMEYRKGTLVEIWRFLNADNEEFVNQTFDERYVGPLKGEWNFGVLHLNIWHELFADTGHQYAELMQKGRSSSGATTPVSAPVAAPLVKSKSSDSIKSMCAENSPKFESPNTTNELNLSMTSSFHQPVVLSSTNDGLTLLDWDGLLKLQDDEQATLRKKNRLRQEQMRQKDREINELRRQRALSERSGNAMVPSPISNIRMNSVSESETESGLERAMSDLSVVDPETEMPDFKANTTWETRATNCNLCRRPLNELSMYHEERQHHCRNCGKVVCENCSKQRYAVVEEGQSVQKRVCDACYNSMHETKNDRLVRAASLSEMSFESAPFGSIYSPNSSPSSSSLNMLPSSSINTSTFPQPIPSSCKSSSNSISPAHPSSGEFTRHSSSQAVKG